MQAFSAILRPEVCCVCRPCEPGILIFLQGDVGHTLEHRDHDERSQRAAVACLCYSLLSFKETEPVGSQEAAHVYTSPILVAACNSSEVLLCWL